MSDWRAEVRMTLGDLRIDLALGGPAQGTHVVALIGPNGSGKSSVLRALTGTVAVERCVFRIAETVIVDSQAGLDTAPESRRIGYVAQGYALFPHLSVLDNVAFGLTVGPGRESRAGRRDRAHDILRDLGCAGLVNRPLDALSGGERQRIALARALVTRPRMLMLDEPLAALDAVTRRGVRSFLSHRLSTFAGPVLLVTHDARDIDALGAHICAIEEGRVVQTGTAEQLRHDPATAFIAEFFSV